MIVDKANSFLSQRKLPKMALISQKLAGDCLVLTAPGKSDLNVLIQTPGKKIKCRYTHIIIYNVKLCEILRIIKIIAFLCKF